MLFPANANKIPCALHVAVFPIAPKISDEAAGMGIVEAMLAKEEMMSYKLSPKMIRQ